MAPWAPHIPREVTVQGYRAHHRVLGKSTVGWKAGTRAALILGWILQVCKLATEGPGGPSRLVGSPWDLGTGSWWGCRSGLATEETHLNMCMSVQLPLEDQEIRGADTGLAGCLRPGNRGLYGVWVCMCPSTYVRVYRFEYQQLPWRPRYQQQGRLGCRGSYWIDWASEPSCQDGSTLYVYMYHICFPLTCFNSDWLEKRTDEEVGVVCVSASAMCPDCVDLWGWPWVYEYKYRVCACTC